MGFMKSGSNETAKGGKTEEREETFKARKRWRPREVGRGGGVGGTRRGQRLEGR